REKLFRLIGDEPPGGAHKALEGEKLVVDGPILQRGDPAGDREEQADYQWQG
ncbi:MAG: hypothetical protein IPK44_14695, partial [Candidatus Accumulibacter sp.]|nr:hypothetical protein [Accumulibacter sp.]